MSFTNVLLRSLSSSDLSLIEPSFSTVELSLSHIVEQAGVEVESVHFVESGLLSIVSEYEAGREVEVGIIGREGFTNVGITLGDRFAVHKTNVQIAGVAIRLPAKVLAEAMDRSQTLRRRLALFTRALEIQTASTASANGRANLEERLARWLLMVQDRMDSDVLSITHEFLAQMLCCRRPGVTVGLHLLEGKGYIRSTRGRVAVMDRAGLEDASNGSYGRAEREYARLLEEDFRSLRAPGAAFKAKMQEILSRNGRAE